MDHIKTTSYNITDALHETCEQAMDCIKHIVKRFDINSLDEFDKFVLLSNNDKVCVELMKVTAPYSYSTISLMIESALWCKRNKYRW